MTKQSTKSVIAILCLMFIAHANGQTSQTTSPVSNPSGPTFDCSKAQTPVETTICSNSQLSKLDVDLLRIYRQALASQADQSSLKESQIAWRKSRNACVDANCLVQYYSSRISALQKLINTAATNSAAAPPTQNAPQQLPSALPRQLAADYIVSLPPGNKGLRLRSQPNTQGDILQLLPADTAITVLKRQDDAWWYIKVISSGLEGWALSSLNGNSFLQQVTETQNAEKNKESVGSQVLDPTINGTDPWTSFRLPQNIAQKSYTSEQVSASFSEYQALVPQIKDSEARNDYISVLRLLSPFAKRGNVAAIINIAIIYEHGYGVTKDLKKARELLETAQKIVFSSPDAFEDSHREQIQNQLALLQNAEREEAQLAEAEAEQKRQETERLKAETERIRAETEQKIAIEKARAEAAKKEELIRIEVQAAAKEKELELKKEQDTLELQKAAHDRLSWLIPILGCSILGYVFYKSLKSRSS